MAKNQFAFVVKSTILRGEAPTTPLSAAEAATVHQMNRVTGYLPDGTKVLVAQRPGKGGMEFNKLLGGKVYAVAADGISPVFVKENGKATSVQKLEEGLPLYSTSGFYLLSSKDYPALGIGEYFTLLREQGHQVVLVSDDQVNLSQQITLESSFDLELLAATAVAALNDDQNSLSKYDQAVNAKRKKVLSRAKEDAEDSPTPVSVAEFKELRVSKRDGNPALVLFWSLGQSSGPSGTVLTREKTVEGPERSHTTYLSPEETWEAFCASTDYQAIVQAIEKGTPVRLGIVQAHVMRTSVSFRKKVKNVLDLPPSSPRYGDAVYIEGALRGWCRGIVAIFQSQHPLFPAQDYDAHHYVAAVRQAEVGMNRTADEAGWLPPQIVSADLATRLLAA